MKVWFVQTTETCADPLRDLARCQQACRFDDPSLAVQPLRLDQSEPRTLDRQRADDDPHRCRTALDRSVVCRDSSLHRLAHMPAGVVPYQRVRRIPLCHQPFAVPSEELCCHRAHRTPVPEAQPQPLVPLPRIPLPHQQAITGECLVTPICLLHKRPL